MPFRTFQAEAESAWWEPAHDTIATSELPHETAPYQVSGGGYIKQDIEWTVSATIDEAPSFPEDDDLKTQAILDEFLAIEDSVPSFVPYHPETRPKFREHPLRMHSGDTSIDEWCSSNVLSKNTDSDEDFDRHCAWWEYRPKPSGKDMTGGAGGNCEFSSKETFIKNFHEITGEDYHHPAVRVPSEDNDDLRAWKLHPFETMHPVHMMCDMNVISLAATPEVSPLFKALDPFTQDWVRTELRQYRQRWDRRLRSYAIALKNYLFLACWGEARHHKMIGGTLIPGTGQRKSARVAGRILTSRWGESTAARFLEMAFDADSKWGSSYGGLKWQQIATVLRLYVENEMPDIVFIDRVMNLQHNGGICLNKVSWPCWVRESTSEQKLHEIQHFFGPAHTHDPPLWSVLMSHTTPETYAEVQEWNRFMTQRRGPGMPPYGLFSTPVSVRYTVSKSHVMQVETGGFMANLITDWLPDTGAQMHVPETDKYQLKARLMYGLSKGYLSEEMILKVGEALGMSAGEAYLNARLDPQIMGEFGIAAPVDLDDILIPEGWTLIEAPHFLKDLDLYAVSKPTRYRISLWHDKQILTLNDAKVITNLIRLGVKSTKIGKSILFAIDLPSNSNVTFVPAFKTIEQVAPTFNLAIGSKIWEQLTVETDQGDPDAD
jgi:hypothetical protein